MTQPNRYGAMAQQHWAQFLPNRYQAIENPDSFFSRLGQEVADEIEETAQQLAGTDQPDEGYLGKLGRLNAARSQAQEKVLAERVLLPAEPGSERDETPPEERQTPPEDEAAYPEPTTMSSEPIPVMEDPSHPYWQTVREQEELDRLQAQEKAERDTR